MMKLLLVSVMLAAVVVAQVPQKFDAFKLRAGDMGVGTQRAVHRLPAMDIAGNIKRAALANANDTKVFEFGQVNEMNVDFFKEASQTEVDGGTLYTLTYFMSNALSMAFHFENFALPEGCALFLVSKSDVGGPWTHESKWTRGDFMTRHILGNEVAIRLYVSDSVKSDVTLNLDVITTAYRDAKEFAGVCNINSICRNPANRCTPGCVPTNRACSVACTYYDQTVSMGQWAGEEWSPQIRAGVAVARNMNSRYCSGSFINNHARKQYVLTAYHCGPARADLVQVGFFNPDCTSASDTIGDVSKVAGNLIPLSRNQGVDNELLEIGEVIPVHWNVYLAGYEAGDRTNGAVGTVGVHHPAGANQKVCHSPLQVTPTSWSGAILNHWRVEYWTEGTTEPGSSGSPLYSRQSKRIIGQLHGGSAACPARNGYDSYGAVWAGYEAGMNTFLGPVNMDGRELYEESA